MKRTALILAIVIPALSAFSASNTVRVKADRVILRVEPSYQGEVATQVDAGTILVGRERSGEWLQVAPPTNLFFWVHSKYVEEGVVTGSRVRVRLGPGVEFLQVCELVKDNTVVSRGEQNGWLKIDPPEGLYLWIHADLVEDASKARAKPAPQPKVVEEPADPIETAPAFPAPAPRPPTENLQAAPEPAVSVPSRQEETSAVPDYVARLGLVPLKGQGITAEYDGYLEKIDWPIKGPTSYRLVVDPRDGSKDVVCFVMGNSAQLVRLQGSKLTVSGKEYWVRGSKQPLVVLERIVVRQKRIDSSHLSGRRDRAP